MTTDNPFEYKTDPELNYIVDKLHALKKRVEIEFAKAEKIAGLTSGAGFKSFPELKIPMPNYREMRNPYSSRDRPMPLSTIDAHVSAANAVAEAALIKAEEDNQATVDHNDSMRKQIIEFMTRIGVTQSYTTYEYATTRSKTKTSRPHPAGYLADIDRVMPRSPVISARYSHNSYMSEYRRWIDAERAAAAKKAIDDDAKAVNDNILNNPKLVGTLMQAGVNILEEVQKADAGKKSNVIEYCKALAINNVISKNRYIAIGYNMLLALKCISVDRNAYVDNALANILPGTDADLRDLIVFWSGNPNSEFSLDYIWSLAGDEEQVILLKQLSRI